MISTSKRCSPGASAWPATWNVTTSPLRNETGDCRETDAAWWTSILAGAGRGHGGGVHDSPVHADPSDAHERAVSQAVAGLQSEAVTLVLEAAGDVELADHEVGHAHPGSLAGRDRSRVGGHPEPGRRTLPAGGPLASQCVLP